MVFVMAVMVTVLIILYVSSYQSSQNSITRSLSMALSGEQKDLRPSIGTGSSDKGNGFAAGTGAGGTVGRPSSEDHINTVFTVTVDSDGNIQSIDDSMVNIDESTASSAAQAALADGKSRGTVSSLSLAYMTQSASDGTKIAFVDITSINASLKKLLINELLIFFGSALVFFVISLYLARLVVKPVEEAWNRQKQFVADASHELKTPLTVILANLEILKTHPDETIEQEGRWIDSTKEESVRMKGLLDDLLFLARNDASQTPVMKQEIDFSSLVWSTTLLFESVAFEKKVELTEEIAEGLFVTGDEKQLKQLLTILLDNACKYGKNGKVTVSLKAAEKEKLLLCVNNSVNDEKGVIPREEQAHVFERFYRGDKARVHTEGGYGLGLSIAAAIVENHHGKIKVSSDMEHGTTFTVILPEMPKEREAK